MAPGLAGTPTQLLPDPHGGPLAYSPLVPRIVGIDTARGLAVLGMMTAHVGPDDAWRATPPGGWAQLADGRPAALFVVLAGLSLALLSGGTRPVSGGAALSARTRILVRAAILLVLGYLLIALGTPIAVILPTYAVLFAIALVPLRWSRGALLAAAGAVALVGPLLRHWYQGLGTEPLGELGDLLFGHYYPAAVWLAYVLAGLALGRTDLSRARTRWVLAACGLAAVLVGHVGAWLLRTQLAAPAWWATTEPHSSTTLELIANTGVATLVIVGAVALGERFPRALAPISAVGALALTAYTVHIVTIAIIGPEVVYEPTIGSWLVFLGVTLVACWAWRAWLGRGPLERLMHGLSTRAARAIHAG